MSYAHATRLTTTPDPHQPDPADPVFALHRGGKLETALRCEVKDARDLSLAYSPGVAKVCSAIADDLSLVDVYTTRASTIAVVSDGTAVLGLGDIGPHAAMPVMEGKAMLFKAFAGINAVPICLDTTDADQIVEMVAALAPTFGGVNLEDISAPRCFEIEERLKARLDIPVFHDDQHGTAVVTLAGLTNGARVLGRELGSLRIVITGAGAAGVAITQMLQRAGVRDIVVCDRQGIIGPERRDLPEHKRQLAATTNHRGLSGDISRALRGADVLIGVAGGSVPESAVARMALDAMIFALANPDPEVHPDVAARHAAIVATGRSDYPNQINNVLAFPGIFKGALAAGATRITEGMKLAAAQAIADCVPEPTPEQVVPSPFDPQVVTRVADAVAERARAEGVTRSR
ncbi:NAD(P)-dependent malic enzyme [Arsenicicoccus sp. oral taxon 190]|uniref:NAD(P)-dependent malic enzyme n=1 Tax=Arsenicicoccus sp. oral taxon 190 TaxID=1658671 RepID=UPI000679ECA5|nr:NADP-dependent malic enzyme [Arsenicicoccus sp. oral taxon 190]AKT50536.1 malate dehydrogenase [Arsenicicoccus sp. oral taxon 190]